MRLTKSEKKKRVSDWIKKYKIEEPFEGHIRTYKAVYNPNRQGLYPGYYQPERCQYKIGALIKLGSRMNLSTYHECGRGLHVSTFRFANEFRRTYISKRCYGRNGEYVSSPGTGKILSCLVPLDAMIVVPNDLHWDGFKLHEKIRVDRLIVEGEVAINNKNKFIHRVW